MMTGEPTQMRYWDLVPSFPVSYHDVQIDPSYSSLPQGRPLQDGEADAEIVAMSAEAHARLQRLIKTVRPTITSDFYGHPIHVLAVPVEKWDKLMQEVIPGWFWRVRGGGSTRIAVWRVGGSTRTARRQRSDEII